MTQSWSSASRWWAIPVQRLRMAIWTWWVNGIVADPPGTDDDFTPEEIERNSRFTFTSLSSWSIVCEEVLDTAFPHSYFERAREELRRRGVSDSDYQEMRRLAWLTAGWLNYKKKLWGWTHIDEQDIRYAIDWQFAEGWISQATRDRWVTFFERFATRVEG